MIDYSHNYKIKWYSLELQKWFYLASISSHEQTKMYALGKAAEVRAR